MANTDRISGKDVFVSFLGYDLSADFTSVSFSEDGDHIDVTAADDDYHYYIPVRKDGTIDFEGFYTSPDATVFGTVAVNAAGTLIIGPAGTATGRPKYTWNRVVVASRSLDMPFDDGVTFSVSFQMSSEVEEGTF
jgi:hypothetical protein